MNFINFRQHAMRSAIVTGWASRPRESEQIYNHVAEYLNVLHYDEYDFGDSEDQETLAVFEPHFLFNFGPLIIQPVLLDAVKEGCINFHPAPPQYPGRGGASYALYNQDELYGVTAHIMTEEVDTGPILDVYEFPISPDITAHQLHDLAIRHIPLFARHVIDKAVEGRLAPTTQYEWASPANTQRDLVNFMSMTINTNEWEMERRIAAVRHPEKPGPFIEFRGRKWFYIDGLS